MAQILLTWELGGGVGHITPHLGLARTLAARGHAVAFALRSLEQAERLLGPLGVRYYQAPTRLHVCPCPVQPVTSYAQVLHNVGFYARDVLLGRVKAWRALFELLQPDLLLCDFSPGALLAAHCDGLPCVRVGTGYANPPLTTPLPPLLTLPNGRDTAADEQRVLGVINAVLARLDRPPLANLAALHARAPAWLQTYPELDHYPGRGAAHYRPVDCSAPGLAPQWPELPGPRLYGYLKNGAYLVPLLEAVGRLGWPALLVGDNVPESLQRAVRSPNIAWAGGHLDMVEVSRSCTLGITNANHATLVNLLLGGCPQLLFPLTMEQQVLSLRVVGIQAGLTGGPPDKGAILNKIKELIDNPRYAEGARAFAERHAGIDFAATTLAQADTLEELLRG